MSIKADTRGKSDSRPGQIGRALAQIMKQKAQSWCNVLRQDVERSIAHLANRIDSTPSIEIDHRNLIRPGGYCTTSNGHAHLQFGKLACSFLENISGESVEDCATESSGKIAASLASVEVIVIDITCKVCIGQSLVSGLQAMACSSVVRT